MEGGLRATQELMLEVTVAYSIIEGGGLFQRRIKAKDRIRVYSWCDVHSY